MLGFGWTSAHILLYQIPDEFRATAASVCLLGRASHWYQVFKESVGTHTWLQLSRAILEEFGTNTHRCKVIELFTLRHTDSVEEYRKQFE